VAFQVLIKKLLNEYDLFLFDFRGHGQSSGLFTWMSREEAEVHAVLQHLESHYDRIGIIGFSLGGSIVLNVLSQVPEYNVHSFVCISAPSDFYKTDILKLWQLDWENDVVYHLLSKEGRTGRGVRPGPLWLTKKRPLDYVEKLQVPVLYMYGSLDWIVKPHHGMLLYNKTKSPKKINIIEQGPHAEFLLRKYPQTISEDVYNWFQTTL